MKKATLVAAYLLAVVAANVLTWFFGPAASIANAFFMVGFVLVVRDVLNEEWAGHRAKMFALIAAGGAASYILTGGGAVAIASCVAFAASESIDFVVYTVAKGTRFSRSNRSNIAGAIVDSIIFPTIAFGGFAWSVSLAQMGAKVAGGAVFAWLFFRFPSIRRIAASAGAAALLLLVASPARAGWLADVGIGGAKTSGLDAQAVGEVFVATPVALGFRAYATASWNLENTQERPDVLIAAVTRSVAGGQRGWAAINAGATAFAFEDYGRAHPFVGATVGVPISSRSAIVLVGSHDLDHGGQTVVLKVTRSIR